MATTEGKIYITALRTLEKLEVQFVPPQIAFTRTPKYAGIAVVGRNNPLNHYTGGTTSLNFELDFHAEQTNREDVIRKCKWLEALGNNDGFDHPPEQVRLTFGGMFKNNEVWIVTSINIVYSRFDKVYNYLPVQAYATLTLTLDPDFNLKTRNIKWS